jgi:phenylpyruvate tautomerase PptA (4-oxalocrotonate tautomerase family)
MAQIKIYGHKAHIERQRQALSDVIHACVVKTLQLPPDKRFHRFFALEAEDFVHPDDRTGRYTILEISMFEGRSIEVKKQLINLLFSRLESALGIAPQDVEITIFETPRHNWGIRGLPGDELGLNYRVEV